MIKPRLLKFSKFLFIAFLGLAIGSCSPEDGINGTNGIDGKDGIGIDGKDGVGIDGKDGINGVDGKDGVDGANGLGFDDLVKYGSITTTISGTRPDGVAFEQNNKFSYTSAGANYTQNNVYKDGSDLDFYFRRFLSVPDDVYQDVSTTIGFKFENSQPVITEFEVQELKVFSATDNKYFRLDADPSNFENMEITGYSFDSATNNLKFTYSFTIDENDNNSSGYDLNVTGVVDVILFEEIAVP